MSPWDPGPDEDQTEWNVPAPKPAAPSATASTAPELLAAYRMVCADALRHLVATGPVGKDVLRRMQVLNSKLTLLEVPKVKP